MLYEVITDLTIKLFANRTDAMAAPTSFNPATSPDTVTSDDYIHLSGFSNGDAVTYVAPTPFVFKSEIADTVFQKDTDSNTDGDQPGLVNTNNNYLLLSGDTNGDGNINDSDAGHGIATGEKP